MPEIKLDEYLKQFSGKDLVFYPFSGNAGDALISLAAYQKFASHKIAYSVFGAETEITSRTILVFNGGGHLYSKYHNNSKLLEKYRDLCRMIVLPQSVSGHEELFKSLGDNVEIICREEVSYGYLNSIGTGAGVHLADDLALSLDARRLLAESTILKDKAAILPLKKRLRSWIKLKKKEFLYRRAYMRAPSPLPDTELNVFREDGESLGRHQGKASLDLSLLFAYRPAQMTPAHAELATVELLTYLNHFDTINTDRLHVAIGALLLGKRVNFYPNNYFKNESIYEYSLAKRFENNLNWHGA